MSISVGSAIDNLDAALKANIIPNQEYFLQGSIIDTSVEVLLHRLRGLCDNVDTDPETFHDHEMCFSIRRGPPPEQPLTLRVRRALDHKDMPYQLRYIGIAEIGDKSQPTAVRSSIDVATTSNVVEFLTELGYRLEHEYVARGFMFTKGRMKAVVSKIFKTKTSGNSNSNKSNKSQLNDNLSNIEPLTNSYLVELSVLAPGGQSAVGDEMRLFAEQLKPLVHMEKIDQKRM